MKQGIIIKGIGGFYYVRSDNEVYECKARGKFRNKKITPLVGDKVRILYDELTEQGSIEEIEERTVELIRPPVANINQAVIVFAIQNPAPNMILLDKILAMAEFYHIDIVLCFNKVDLARDEEVENLKERYKGTGYKVLFCSTKNNVGIDSVKDVLKDKVTVFAGPSGVGKSSILNLVQSGLKLKTGELSNKIKRGKHTTRHSELLELDEGGYVVDSPGFTSLSLDFIEKEELCDLFPEFHDYVDDCKFSNCIHINEPKCRVKEAVENGEINRERYESYLYFINERDNRR